MKLEYFALGFTLIAVGIGGFYYLDGQLAAQMASYEAGGEFLYSAEMTDLMDKVRLGLFATALAGVAIAGFGATGKIRLGRSERPELGTAYRAFCMHCGTPGSVSGYCAVCGQGRQASSVFRRCARCGRNSGDDSEFCVSCGWKF